MFVTLSILLLFLFALGFWLVKESKVPLWMKVVTISLFFCFCVLMTSMLDSSMGWASIKTNFPKIITIRFVVVKEPNPSTGFDGSIFLLLDQHASKSDSALLNLFGHKTEVSEPRLYKIPYSRQLHEQLAKDVIPRLMKGQTVTGRFGKKGSGEGESGEGDGDGDGDGSGQGKGHGKKGGRGHGKGSGKGGGGSESLEQNDMMFYELPPTYFQEKH